MTLNRIFISGYFGFGNLGDEAILDAVVTEFRRRDPSTEFAATFGPNRDTAARLNVQAVDFFSVDNLATEIAASDVLLFGLGGVFQDYWGANSTMLFNAQTNGVEAYVRPALLAKMAGVPAILFSAGIGPLRTNDGRALFRLACDSAEMLIVRDEASAAETRSIDPAKVPIIAADPGFLLETSDSDRTAVDRRLNEAGFGAKPFAAVAVRTWEFEVTDEEIAQHVSAALDRLPAEWEIVFVPFHRGAGTDDRTIAEAIAAKTKRRSTVFAVDTASEAIALFEKSRLVVAARNHAVVFAGAAGVPVVSIAYDPKVAASAAKVGAAPSVPFRELPRLPGVVEETLRAETFSKEAVDAKRRDARRGALVAFDLVEKSAALRSAATTTGVSAAELDRQARSFRQEIAEKQRQISTLQKQLEDRDTTIRDLQATMNAAVTERDQMIRSLQAQMDSAIAQRDEMIRSVQATMNAAVAERDGEIQRLQKVFETGIAERDEMIRSVQATMNAAVAERDTRIAERDGMISSVQSAMSELKKDLDTASDERDVFRETIEQLKDANVEALRQYDSAMGVVSRRTEERDSFDAELRRIVESKLWKVASSYWWIREKLRRHPSAPATSVPSTTEESSGPVAEALAAPPVRPAGKPRTVVQVPSVNLEAPIAVENRFDVVCFPIIDWGFRFQRPQQLMSQFAAAGHRVFYVSQKFRQHGAPYQLKKLRDNVYEVSLRGPAKKVYTDRLTPDEAKTFFDSLDALRKKESLGATASVIELPFWTAIAEIAREQLAWPMVYDCMDHHAGFTTNTDEMLNEEARLLRTSDLVIVSSHFLENEAKKHNEHVLMVRNACDYEHFSKVKDVANPRPIVGYYGAIADWFDADLVADLAERRPDWDFLLVGSTFTADVSRLKKLRNVTMAGEKPYTEIPGWLERMDVCIVPFKRIPLTEATNPVKAYEMLAGGKPVVSVPIPEVAPLAPLVRLASTAEEFEREVLAAMEENNDIVREKRRAFARENTWTKRYELLAPRVAQSFPLASIVVVTYNSVDLNRLCIESLYERSEWPNVEVFVVDNASADATPQYLREAESKYPRLKVILNSENRGFAAANNQALKLATGDYLVLLNNDTVSPRGWFAALIRHLKSDRIIGMIGPSTNAIGNEAMIDVPYTEISGMPAFARDFMREYDGKTFEIPMLAMFCVCIPRPVFDQIGMLDENFGIGMYEDDDYAHRMKLAGYRIVCARDSFVHHWMKAAFAKLPSAEYKKLFEKNREYYERKWSVKWQPHKRA